MLDFAVKLTERPTRSRKPTGEALRKAGFSDRDIWDIAAVASFYNMSNRMAAATDMRPNKEYHYWVRERGEEASPAAPSASQPVHPPQHPWRHDADPLAAIRGDCRTTLESSTWSLPHLAGTSTRVDRSSGRTDWCGICAIPSPS